MKKEEFVDGKLEKSIQLPVEYQREELISEQYFFLFSLNVRVFHSRTEVIQTNKNKISV